MVIKSSFDKGRNIEESLQSKVNKVYIKPTIVDLGKLGVDGRDFHNNNKLCMKWEIYYQDSMEQKIQFDKNWTKAYGTIFWSYFSKDMQLTLKELPEFKVEI